MSALFGFPASFTYRFSLGGQRWRVSTDGVETLHLLQAIYQASKSGGGASWALGVRDHVRRIQSLGARSVLSLVVDRTGDRRMRVLAIWLRGRCGGYIGTSVLARFTSSPDFQTRKETARALKRMSGWSQLSEMAATDTDSRIRRIATSVPPKPHRSRLAKFSRNLEPVPLSSERRRLWVLPGLRIENVKPPRSAMAIRRILERIHRLVTGGPAPTER